MYRLKKTLYDLKQVPKAWYYRIGGHFLHNGFKRSVSDPILYVKSKGTNELLVVCLYVDDLTYIGNSAALFEEFKYGMIHDFEMTDLVQMKYFLGLEVKQCDE